MRSLNLVMSECSLSGHGQGHMSNFYIVDLENFATASRRYTGDIHNTSVVGLIMTFIRQWKRLGWVHMFITHRPTLTLQLRNFDLFRTCRTSSFCTVAWQLARFQLTRRIDRSLGDSWASCIKSRMGKLTVKPCRSVPLSRVCHVVCPSFSVTSLSSCEWKSTESAKHDYNMTGPHAVWIRRRFLSTCRT